VDPEQVGLWLKPVGQATMQASGSKTSTSGTGYHAGKWALYYYSGLVLAWIGLN